MVGAQLYKVGELLYKVSAQLYKVGAQQYRVSAQLYKFGALAGEMTGSRCTVHTCRCSDMDIRCTGGISAQSWSIPVHTTVHSVHCALYTLCMLHCKLCTGQCSVRPLQARAHGS